MLKHLGYGNEAERVRAAALNTAHTGNTWDTTDGIVAGVP
jgi:hypothetical protein